MNRMKKTLLKISNFIEKRYQISVGAKIFVPFFIITFVLGSIISYYAINRVTNTIMEMEQKKASVVLKNTMNTFKEQTKSLEADVRLISGCAELENGLASGDKKQMFEILTPAKYYSGQQKIMVYDRNKHLVAQLDGPLKNKVVDDKIINQALAGTTVSSLNITQNGMELFAGNPVNYDPEKYGDRLPSGALVVERYIDIDDLKAIKAREGVEINIFYKGKLVTSTLDSNVQDDILPKILATMTNKNNFRTINISDKLGYINTWSTLGDGVISVMVPNDELKAVNGAIFSDLSRITILAGLFVLLLSYFLAKIISLPLVRMTNITKAISRGDFTQRNEVFTNDEFGQLGVAINSMADKIKSRIEEAEHLATVDGLTGMYNHRYLQQRLGEELGRAQRFSTPLSILMMDIDYFKHYNDNQGHPAGDKVLQDISRIIGENIRSLDIAARYGGEEFAIILLNAGPEEAIVVGEKIRQAVEQFPFEGREEQPSGKLTISMGIATYPLNATKKDELIKMADDALYKAKYISRNKVILYYSVLDDLKSELDNSEQDLINTIKTLITVINTKDKYTYGHSERVAQYAVSIAEALNLSLEETKKIRVGAYLHDIGKIEINREILNKIGKLNEEEYEVLMQHPLWGAQIARSANPLKEIEPAILYHHEKFDGTGYPMGLKGADIPLMARIIKVADSFDAMTSTRPYQVKKSMAQAREEIIKCSGKDFDPLVVTVFVSLLDGTVRDNNVLVS